MSWREIIKRTLIILTVILVMAALTYYLHLYDKPGLKILWIPFATALFAYWLSYKHRQLQLKKEFRDPLVKFAEDAIRQMTQSSILIKKDWAGEKDFEEFRIPLQSELSSLIAIGRLYLPNEEKDRYGVGKLSTARGYRPLPLDTIFVVFEFVNRIRFSDLNNQNKLQNLLDGSLKKLHSDHYKAAIRADVKNFDYPTYLQNIIRVFIEEINLLIDVDSWNKYFKKLVKKRARHIDRY